MAGLHIFAQVMTMCERDTPPHLNIEGQIADKHCPVALVHNTASSAAVTCLAGSVHTDV